MRRRNKQLENKLATLYVQLKDKDEALKQIHEEYHLTKTNLEKSNMDKGKKYLKVPFRIPTVKLKIPGKLFLKSNPEFLLHSSYSF